jgi:ribonuclease I
MVFQYCFRKRLSLQVLENLGTVLHTLADGFEVDSLQVATAMTETFRALRNSCVGEPRIQKALTERTIAVDETRSILKSLASLPRNQCNVTCLLVGTQFLGNLVVNNKESQPVIWNKCSEILM